MKSLTLRATGLLFALAASSTCLLAPTPTAAAATTVDTAASALGLGSYRVTEVPGSGDITGALTSAVKSAGSIGQAHVVHLPAGQLSVDSMVRFADHVFIVAEPGTTVTWKGKDDYLLRFVSVTGGVYGGTWNGANRASTTLIGITSASVQVSEANVTDAGKYGIGAYQNSSLVLRNVAATANKVDGVHLEGSSLDASVLRSTSNRRNGVQLSSGSTGTITDSFLDRNGQAVKGSTTGKTGHGLGVAAAQVTVLRTSISSNKVCGVSLTRKAIATISGSHLDRNGRHGLGTFPGTTATISDSTVNKNGYNGVLASGTGTHVTLQRVTIAAAKRSGLSVPSGGTATIEGSTITGPPTGAHKYDISVSGKGSLFMLGDNTISSSRSHGITVSGKGTIKITGEGNQVVGNRGDGLRLTGSGTTGRITASVLFRDNRNSGIVVVSKAKLEKVACSFSGNKKTVEKRSGGKVTDIS